MNEIIDNRWENVGEIQLEMSLVSPDISKVYRDLSHPFGLMQDFPPNTLNFILIFSVVNRSNGFTPPNLQIMNQIYFRLKKQVQRNKIDYRTRGC